LPATARQTTRRLFSLFSGHPSVEDVPGRIFPANRTVPHPPPCHRIHHATSTRLHPVHAFLFFTHRTHLHSSHVLCSSREPPPHPTAPQDLFTFPPPHPPQVTPAHPNLAQQPCGPVSYREPAGHRSPRQTTTPSTTHVSTTSHAGALNRTNETECRRSGQATAERPTGTQPNGASRGG